MPVLLFCKGVNLGGSRMVALVKLDSLAQIRRHKSSHNPRCGQFDMNPLKRGQGQFELD